MPLIKVRKSYQITIPADLREQLGLEVGDLIEVKIRNGKLILTPQKDEDDSWFWSEEWQAKEREADEAIRKGDFKEFDNIEDLIKDLRS